MHTFSRTLIVMLVYYKQETDQLFEEIRKIVHSTPPSDEKTKLIDLLLQCELVEVVQRMWRQCLTPKLLEKNTVLPPQLSSSFGVMHISYVHDTRSRNRCHKSTPFFFWRRFLVRVSCKSGTGFVWYQNDSGAD